MLLMGCLHCRGTFEAQPLCRRVTALSSNSISKAGTSLDKTVTSLRKVVHCTSSEG